MIQETYTIKEVAEMTGFKAHVIRFYEKEFNIDIPRNENNRRYFTYKEVETFLNIKGLQEKGLTNKQIKTILEAPEEILPGHLEGRDPNSEVAITSFNRDIQNYGSHQNEQWLKELSQYLRMEIENTLQQVDYGRQLEDLTAKVDELRNELIHQEKDILICENAKLKMKLKEKSYEIAELKDKLKREQYKKVSMFERLFGKKKDMSV